MALNPRSPSIRTASSSMSGDESVQIREVWGYNLEYEFRLIECAVVKYPYIAMDTEFPGVVLQYLGQGLTVQDYAYNNIKCNVDILKLIQLGLTFADGDGNLPVCSGGKKCVWQFNFREFDPKEDICASDSIAMLRNSGIDFERHRRCGIDRQKFGELLTSSGAILNNDVQWVTFHSSYDFAYMIRLLTGKVLPDTLEEFRDLVAVFFPVLNDLKHIVRHCDGLHGGLSRIAEVLDVRRIGVSHQAGSDSLLTFRVFIKFNGGHLDGSVGKDAGTVYGFGGAKSNNVPKVT